jgi:hypothetical protein
MFAPIIEIGFEITDKQCKSRHVYVSNTRFNPYLFFAQVDELRKFIYVGHTEKEAVEAITEQLQNGRPRSKTI